MCCGRLHLAALTLQGWFLSLIYIYLATLLAPESWLPGPTDMMMVLAHRCGLRDVLTVSLGWGAAGSCSPEALRSAVRSGWAEMQRAGPLHGKLHQGKQNHAPEMHSSRSILCTHVGPTGCTADIGAQCSTVVHILPTARGGPNPAQPTDSLRLWTTGARAAVPALHLLHCEEGRREALLLHGCPGPQCVCHPALPSR